MKLVYTSNPLSLVIANCEPISFEYNEWIVSDEYAYNEAEEPAKASAKKKKATSYLPLKAVSIK